MDVIVFTRADGGVTVRNLPRNATDDDFDVQIQHAIDSGKATDVPQRVGRSNVETDRTFRNAWERDLSPAPNAVTVNMPKARTTHAERIATAHAAEIALLEVAERQERLKGNTAQADSHAATMTALGALDLGALAAQIAAAPNATALNAIWPAQLPR